MRDDCVLQPEWPDCFSVRKHDPQPWLQTLDATAVRANTPAGRRQARASGGLSVAAARPLATALRIEKTGRLQQKLTHHQDRRQVSVKPAARCPGGHRDQRSPSPE